MRRMKDEQSTASGPQKDASWETVHKSEFGVQKMFQLSMRLIEVGGGGGGGNKDLKSG